MAAMEAVLAARRSPVAEAKPEAARGPGADLRFQVGTLQPAQHGISCPVRHPADKGAPHVPAALTAA